MAFYNYVTSVSNITSNGPKMSPLEDEFDCRIPSPPPPPQKQNIDKWLQNSVAPDTSTQNHHTTNNDEHGKNALSRLNIVTESYSINVSYNVAPSSTPTPSVKANKTTDHHHQVDMPIKTNAMNGVNLDRKHQIYSIVNGRSTENRKRSPISTPNAMLREGSSSISSSLGIGSMNGTAAENKNVHNAANGNLSISNNMRELVKRKTQQKTTQQVTRVTKVYATRKLKPSGETLNKSLTANGHVAGDADEEAILQSLLTDIDNNTKAMIALDPLYEKPINIATSMIRGPAQTLEEKIITEMYDGTFDSPRHEEITYRYSPRLNGCTNTLLSNTENDNATLNINNSFIPLECSNQTPNMDNTEYLLYNNYNHILMAGHELKGQQQQSDSANYLINNEREIKFPQEYAVNNGNNHTLDVTNDTHHSGKSNDTVSMIQNMHSKNVNNCGPHPYLKDKHYIVQELSRSHFPKHQYNTNFGDSTDSPSIFISRSGNQHFNPKYSVPSYYDPNHSLQQNFRFLPKPGNENLTGFSGNKLASMKQDYLSTLPETEAEELYNDDLISSKQSSSEYDDYYKYGNQMHQRQIYPKTKQNQQTYYPLQEFSDIHGLNSINPKRQSIDSTSQFSQSMLHNGTVHSATLKQHPLSITTDDDLTHYRLSDYQDSPRILPLPLPPHYFLDVPNTEKNSNHNNHQHRSNFKDSDENTVLWRDPDLNDLIEYLRPQTESYDQVEKRADTNIPNGVITGNNNNETENNDSNNSKSCKEDDGQSHFNRISLRLHASAYLQHLSYMNNDIKHIARHLDLIPMLMCYLRPEVYDGLPIQLLINVCGCLRNLLYGRDHDSNRQIFVEHDGIRLIKQIFLHKILNESALENLTKGKPTEIDLLLETITGLLWNLSSLESIQTELMKSLGTYMMHTVIIPQNILLKIHASQITSAATNTNNLPLTVNLESSSKNTGKISTPESQNGTKNSCNTMPIKLSVWCLSYKHVTAILRNCSSSNDPECRRVMVNFKCGTSNIANENFKENTKREEIMPTAQSTTTVTTPTRRSFSRKLMGTLGGRGDNNKDDSVKRKSGKNISDIEVHLVNLLVETCLIALQIQDCDNKCIENIMCALRNLCYQLPLSLAILTPKLTEKNLMTNNSNNSLMYRSNSFSKGPEKNSKKFTLNTSIKSRAKSATRGTPTNEIENNTNTNSNVKWKIDQKHPKKKIKDKWVKTEKNENLMEECPDDGTPSTSSTNTSLTSNSKQQNRKNKYGETDKEECEKIALLPNCANASEMNVNVQHCRSVSLTHNTDISNTLLCAMQFRPCVLASQTTISTQTWCNGTNPTKNIGQPTNSSMLQSSNRLPMHSFALGVCLGLLRECANPCTLEAAAGSLQNLAAYLFWKPSIDIRMAVRKEKGLPILVELLKLDHLSQQKQFNESGIINPEDSSQTPSSNNSSLSQNANPHFSSTQAIVVSVLMALRNLALDERNKELIGKYALADLVEKLPDPSLVTNFQNILVKDSHDPNKTHSTKRLNYFFNEAKICGLLAVLHQITKDSPEFALSFLHLQGIDKLMFLIGNYETLNPNSLRNNSIHAQGNSNAYLYTFSTLPKPIKYAYQILESLWAHKSLRDTYCKSGWKPENFTLPPSLQPSFYRDTNTKKSNNNGINTLNRPLESLSINSNSSVPQSKANGQIREANECTKYGTDKQNNTRNLKIIPQDFKNESNSLYTAVNKTTLPNGIDKKLSNGHAKLLNQENLAEYKHNSLLNITDSWV